MLKDLGAGRHDSYCVGQREPIQHGAKRLEERRRERVLVLRSKGRDETNVHHVSRMSVVLMTKVQFTFPSTVQFTDSDRRYLQVYLRGLSEPEFEVSRRDDYFRTFGRIREQIVTSPADPNGPHSTIAA